MKKLKKGNVKYGSIEAYACACSSSCHATCDCSADISNYSNAYRPVAESDRRAEAQASANYRK